MDVVGLDTNLLVRFLTDDDADQANKVYEVFKQAEQDGSELYVPTLVVFELVWVLKSIYKFERSSILQILSDLISMPIFKFENISIIQSCIRDANNTTFDLSDLLIVYSAKTCAVNSILTFDKKAAKHKLFELVL